jgi:short-subunit dehydrogenase
MKFKEKYGPWALVTGASSGIGEEFARQLAAKGLNVIIAARRKDRLAQLRQNILARHDVEVIAIDVDLLSDDFLAVIKKVTEGLVVGLLVNNAGMLYMGDHLDNTIENELKMIDLNIKVPAVLTHHFASAMVKRKRGGIIFTASMLGFMGTPYASTYAGTKAHEIVKSEGLWYELKPKGVDVITLNPGLTETEMVADYDFSAMPMKFMKPGPVAKSALDNLGKSVRVTPGAMNNIMNWMSKRVMSRNMSINMFGGFMSKVVH